MTDIIDDMDAYVDTFPDEIMCQEDANIIALLGRAKGTIKNLRRRLSKLETSPDVPNDGGTGNG